MDSKSEIENLKQRVDELEKKIATLPPANICCKKCHDCGSVLVPPLKISHVQKLGHVEQYIVCPICLGETSCKREVTRERSFDFKSFGGFGGLGGFS